MKKTLYLFLACLALLSSCVQDELSGGGTPVPLSIADASLATSMTRTATTLNTSGDAIGLFLAASSSYSAMDNIKYSYTTAWSAASTGIYLTKTAASLCAYYPYADGTTVTKALVPTVSSTASDFCYKKGLISSASSSLNFEMGHAYSKLTLNISQGTYSGMGVVSSISIANTNLVTGSTLNIFTGNYTTTNIGGSYTDAAPGISNLTAMATKEYLMVPCTLSGNTTLTLNVDGTNLTGTISNATLGEFVAGSNHTITINLTGTSFVVNSVSTADWVTGSNYSVLQIPTVSSSKVANCYILNPGSSLIIPVNIKGNGDGTLISLVGGTTTITAASAGVLWQTTDGLVTCTDFNSTTQTVTVNAPATDVSGNAVIAAYDASSNILWSWHIWVTSYNPATKTNGTTYSYTNTSGVTNVFMDRNLGATSVASADVNALGLIYQWGRKDPFVNAGTYAGTIDIPVIGMAITKTAVAVSSNLSNTILNPATFYFGTATNAYDWYSVTVSTHSSALWGGQVSTDAKTIFDPCPYGWRVPSFYKTSTSASPWLGLASYQASSYWSTNGFLWTTTPNLGFWPATGSRSVSTGVLGNASIGGNNWSASRLNTTTGYCLTLSSGTVNPASSSSRAYGYAVRCVQTW